uniref:Uncharacterized protein n=1 Tax=Oryza brachyantha TaxID=4533 RepID=J3LNK5_ORYBR
MSYFVGLIADRLVGRATRAVHSSIYISSVELPPDTYICIIIQIDSSPLAFALRGGLVVNW